MYDNLKLKHHFRCICFTDLLWHYYDYLLLLNVAKNRFLLNNNNIIIMINNHNYNKN